MRFDTFLPTETLRPYVKYYAVSESSVAGEYKVFPTTGMVAGFQFCGQLSIRRDGCKSPLAPAGITGICDHYTTLKNTAHIGTILVYFSEVGLARFTRIPADEIFRLSISLKEIFETAAVTKVEDELSQAPNDTERIGIIEGFLMSQLHTGQADSGIEEAVRRIRLGKGAVRIKTLSQDLCMSQSSLEKRFRKAVGCSPKKFSIIVRLSSLLAGMSNITSVSETIFAGGYFDQAHFIKEFKRFTGETPDNIKRSL